MDAGQPGDHQTQHQTLVVSAADDVEEHERIQDAEPQC